MRFRDCRQSSPMRLSSLAPAALKYRRLTERNPCVTPYQWRIRSVLAFDSAEILSGRIGAPSLTGTSAGLPYTEHDDEKTMSLTPAVSIASTNFTVPVTLLSQYRDGCSID